MIAVEREMRSFSNVRLPTETKADTGRVIQLNAVAPRRRRERRGDEGSGEPVARATEILTQPDPAQRTGGSGLEPFA